MTDQADTLSPRLALQPHFRKPKLDSPFQSRLEELGILQDWYDWAGYKAPMSLWDEELEYFAIRSQAALFDISPMLKYRIEGQGAEAFLDRLTLRNVTKLKPGRVHYTAWCDDDGHVLDDGTLFRLSATRFRLCCQERHLPWLLDSAFGFDVEIEEETEQVAGLALQGPTAWSVLDAAGFAGAEALKPFDIATFPHDGGEAAISRTGFTGDLGYELFVPVGSVVRCRRTLRSARHRLCGAQPRPHRGGPDRRERRFRHRRACDPRRPCAHARRDRPLLHGRPE